MTRLCYKTAGESHGPGLIVLIEGVPAGLRYDADRMQEALRRRQQGPGRSKRQSIEADRARVVSGLKGGVAIGSPVALLIENKDATIETLPNLDAPRPGHADLAGALKYASADLRAVLERASARETAARTAAGAVAAMLLAEFGVEVFGYVRSLGAERAGGDALDAAARGRRAASPFFSLDPAADVRFAAAVESADRAGETLGGVVEVVVLGAPPGLGSYMQRDLRLDGRLAAALMSIPAIKGVEIGLGFESASRPGSSVHDAVDPARRGRFKLWTRPTNHAGGIEGGVSNGEPIVVRAAMKPLPTLKRGAASVALTTGEPSTSTYQRSDVCAVPAASVVAESAVAFEIATAFLEKFGGDSLADVRASFENWRARVEEFFARGSENP